MLKTECPNCNKWLHSPMLAEVQTLQCPTCGASVDVNDVYVSAGAYSIHRDVLLKNLFKYQRLLSEARRELTGLLSREGGAAGVDQISINTLKRFMGDLQEMLEGCRNGFRVQAPDKTLKLSIAGAEAEARLVNISSSGVCIDVGSLPAGAYKGVPVGVDFSDNHFSFSVKGEVVWASDSGQIGIRFIGCDAGTKENLRNYIQEKGTES